MRHHLLPLALLLATACTGDGDGVPPPDDVAKEPPRFDVVLTDAPADDLLYLRVDVLTLELQRDDLTYTSNLLASTATVDLLALDGVFEWLVSGELTAGTYVGVRLEIDAFSIEAAALDGSAVTVTPIASTLEVAFDAPLGIDEDEYARIEVDFDLLASLDGDVGTGFVDLTPSGTATTSTGTFTAPMQPFKGVVTAVDGIANVITVDAFSDGDLAAPIGSVDVYVSIGTLLLDEIGAEFPNVPSFLATLVEDASVVDVHGALTGKTLAADQIQIDDVSGTGGAIVAELRGKVVALVPDTSLGLLITEVVMGAPTVLPVLSGLGDPATISVGLDLSTVYVSTGTPTTSAALAIGQTVVVKFDAFATEPFPAALVDVQKPIPPVAGTGVDVSGVPTSIVMHVNALDPAVLSGAVASSTTDVDVQIGAAPLALKVPGDPSLSSTQLQDGLRIVANGALSGTPSVPVLTASSVDVLPGRLSAALVTGTEPTTSTFSTLGGLILDPFGAGLTLGPFTVVIDSACTFSGFDVTDEAGFFDALAAGVAEVDVLGIATGQPSEVRAYAVKIVTLQ